MQRKVGGGEAAVALMAFALLGLAACGPNQAGALAPSASPSVSAQTPTSDWPPPGEVQIGTIPLSAFHVLGQAYYLPPADAVPNISQAKAEADVVSGPGIPYKQPVVVRHSYLMSYQARSSGGKRSLVWVIDISPDQPFLFSGGGEDQTSSTQVSSPSPQTSFSRPPDHWTWAVVNADTGAYDIWFS